MYYQELLEIRKGRLKNNNSFYSKKQVVMMNKELSENKKPRLKNRGFFATPATQAVLPQPSLSLSAILGATKIRLLFNYCK